MEMMDRAGEDRAKLRQDFEQHGLSQNFPGAILATSVTLRKGVSGRAERAQCATASRIPSWRCGTAACSSWHPASSARSRPSLRRRRPARTTLLLGSTFPWSWKPG